MMRFLTKDRYCVLDLIWIAGFWEAADWKVAAAWLAAGFVFNVWLIRRRR